MKKNSTEKSNAEASACAKLILLGEHSVVYGYPAIAVPLPSLRLHVRLKWADRDLVKASVEPEDTGKIVQSLNVARKFLNYNKHMEIEINSGFPMKARLGSSAALNVAIVKALADMECASLSTERISSIAYEMEKIFHGTPSGIDTTVSAYEKPIYFIKGKPPEFIKIKKPLSIIIANTGISASTKEVVAEVRSRREAEPGKYDAIFSKIGEISRKGRECIEEGNIDELGRLMSQNQQLLKEIGVSSPEIDRLVDVSMKNGSLGAKLTGAGKGGCIAALASPEDAGRIAEALKRHSMEAFVAGIQ